MAGDKVNTYAQDDSDILALQLTTDKTFKGYHQLTLTEYNTTTVPAIAAGSAIECSGALYKFDTEEAISTTDPVTSATVADGTVYVCIVPDTTTATAAFTATAPTWSDSKQGWYGTGGQANYRYAEYLMTKATAAYSSKISLKNNYGNKNFLKATMASSQTISSGDPTPVIFDTVYLDYNGLYNNSNGTTTIKESGLYRIDGLMVIENNSSYVNIRFGLNGDTSMTSPYCGRVETSTLMSLFHQMYYFVAGDYFKILVQSNDSSYLINAPHSFITVQRIA